MAKPSIVLDNLEATITKSGQQRYLTFINFIMLAGLILSLILSYVVTNPKQAEFFSTSIDGKSEKIVAIDMPNQSDDTVKEFASMAVLSVYNYNFLATAQQIGNARQFFSPAGWRQLAQAIESSNLIKETRSQLIMTSAIVVRPPLILSKGYVNGVYSWRVQLIILVSYSVTGQKTTAQYPVTLLINRISTLESIKGIGISEFIVGEQYLGGIQ